MKLLISSIKICALITLTFLSGCVGYESGSIMHPGIKTIAIAPVKNDTFEPLASSYLRKNIAEQFVLDGSLELAEPSEADCVLYATIRNVETSAARYDSGDYRYDYIPNEWSVRMEVSFTVIIPGKARPLIDERNVNGSTRYAVNVDDHAARRNGLDNLCHEVSKTIMQYTTEAW